MSKHTPNKCICGHGLPHTNKLLDRWQSICGHCGRAGQRSFRLDEAIADWNRQTAAPDLLEALEGVVDELQQLGMENMPGDTMADLRERCLEARAAIDRAEPKP